MKVMASMLNIPIFVVMDSLVPGEYRWPVFVCLITLLTVIYHGWNYAIPMHHIMTVLNT